MTDRTAGPGPDERDATPPRTVHSPDGAPSRSGAPSPGDVATARVLAALAVWSAVHAAVVPVALSGVAAGEGSGGRTAAAVLLGLVGAVPPAVAVLVPAWRTAPRLAALLAATGVLTVVRAVVAGLPLTGLDGALVAVVAALLLGRRAVTWVGTVTLSGWVAVTSFAAVHDVMSGGPGTIGSAVHWVYGTVTVAAGIGVAHALALRAGLVTAPVEPGVVTAPATALAAPGPASAAPASSAAQDPLTGLVNRLGVELVAAPMIENARRSGQAVHCLFLDVDGLRAVNEAAGLEGGDAVLREVADVMRSCVRGTDVVARWTGDEFVAVGPGTGMSPLELERRVRARIVTHPPVPAEVWNGRVSIGSATLVPWDEGDLVALITKAETDMGMRRSLRRQSQERIAGPQGPLAGR